MPGEFFITREESKSNSFLSYAYCASQGDRDYMEDFHIATTDLCTGEEDTNDKYIPFDLGVSFFAILDGHGGDSAAEAVSSELAKRLRDKVIERREIQTDIKSTRVISDMDIIDTFVEVDNELCSNMWISGTTVTSVLVSRASDGYIEIVCANVGDSRTIMYHNGQISALSTDHKPSLPKERERIEKAGGYVGRNARVNGSLALSRAFGDFIYKHRSLPTGDRVIIPIPDINRVKVKVSRDQCSFLVLASDGVYDVMTNEQIIDFIKEKLADKIPLPQIASLLASNCLESEDNISVIIVQLHEC